mgnify:CR=1 FL=1
MRSQFTLALALLLAAADALVLPRGPLRAPRARSVAMCEEPAEAATEAPAEPAPAEDATFLGIPSSKPVIRGGSDTSWTSKLLSSENGNNILVPVLLLSFIPYFLPDGVLPPEIAAFWNRAAMPTDPNVFPPS